MPLLRHPAPHAWPVLLLALAAGLLEWAALSRSRACDAWQAASDRLSHR